MASTVLRVGAALLLAGAILSLFGIPMVALAGAATGFPPALLGAVALMLLVGGIAGALAFSKAMRGDAAGAFLVGLVAAVLPPVQVVALAGAILCKASPEAGASAPAAVPARASS